MVLRPLVRIGLGVSAPCSRRQVTDEGESFAYLAADGRRRPAAGPATCWPRTWPRCGRGGTARTSCTGRSPHRRPPARRHGWRCWSRSASWRSPASRSCSCRRRCSARGRPGRQRTRARSRRRRPSSSCRARCSSLLFGALGVALGDLVPTLAAARRRGGRAPGGSIPLVGWGPEAPALAVPARLQRLDPRGERVGLAVQRRPARLVRTGRRVPHEHARVACRLPRRPRRAGSVRGPAARPSSARARGRHGSRRRRCRGDGRPPGGLMGTALRVAAAAAAPTARALPRFPILAAPLAVVAVLPLAARPDGAWYLRLLAVALAALAALALPDPAAIAAAAAPTRPAVRLALRVALAALPAAAGMDRRPRHLSPGRRRVAHGRGQPAAAGGARRRRPRTPPGGASAGRPRRRRRAAHRVRRRRRAAGAVAGLRRAPETTTPAWPSASPRRRSCCCSRGVTRGSRHRRGRSRH